MPALAPGAATATAVVWTVSSPSPSMLAKLRLSLCQAAKHAAVVAAAALVVFHDGSLQCASLSDASGLPCMSIAVASVELMPQRRRCELAPPSLRASSVQLVEVDSAADAELNVMRRAIVSRRSHRVDLTDEKAFRGTNYRFVVFDRLALRLGLSVVLYLDCDAFLLASAAPLFEMSSQAALVVARRTWQGVSPISRMEFSPRHLAATARLWGFSNLSSQAFNDGVMLVNAREYCRAGIWNRMLDVARFHEFNQSLFNAAGNQPIQQIAAAGHVLLASSLWNCRDDYVNRVRGHVHNAVEGGRLHSRSLAALTRTGCHIMHVRSEASAWG